MNALPCFPRFLRFLFLSLAFLPIAGCDSQPGIPKGKALPQYFGVYAWNGEKSLPIPPLEEKGGELFCPTGTTLVLYDGSLNANTPLGERIQLFDRRPVRFEVEQIKNSPKRGQIISAHLRSPASNTASFEKVPLQFMPLAKPNMFLAQPAQPLAPGLYSLSFNGHTFRFAVTENGKPADLQSAANPMDEYYVTLAKENGFSTANTESPSGVDRREITGNPVVEHFFRPVAGLNKEMLDQKNLALAEMKSGRGAPALQAARYALAFYRNDNELTRILVDAPLAEAKTARDQGAWSSVYYWCNTGLKESPQHPEFRKMLTEANYRIPLATAQQRFQLKQFDDAVGEATRAEAAAFDEPTREEAKKLATAIRLQQQREAFQAAISSGDWDAAYASASKARAITENEETHSLVAQAQGKISADPHYFGAQFKEIARSKPWKDEKAHLREIGWSADGKEIRGYFLGDYQELCHLQTLTVPSLNTLSVSDSPRDTRNLAPKNLLGGEEAGIKVLQNFRGEVSVVTWPQGKTLVEFPKEKLCSPSSVAISPDKRYLAVGASADDSVALYSLQNGEKVWETTVSPPEGASVARNRSVQSLAFSANGRFIASGSFLGVMMRETETGKVTGHFFSKNARAELWHVVQAGASGTEVAARKGAFGADRLTILNIATGAESAGMPLSKFEPGEITWTPDIEVFGKIVGGFNDVAIQFFDIRQGKAIAKITVDPSVTRLALSPDGRKLALGFRDGSISVWGLLPP